MPTQHLMRRICILTTVLIIFCVAVPHIASARVDILEDLRSVGRLVYGSDKSTDFKRVLENLVKVVLGFVGYVFIILIIWGGIQWMTSGGNEQKIDAAKKRITNAVIGLVLIVTAYAIARFIFSSLISATA